MIKSSSFKEILRLIRIISLSIILICSTVSAFVPKWLSNLLGTNPLMTKCIIILLSIYTGRTILNVISNAIYESYLDILKSESATIANALSDTIDLTDDEIDTAINRLTLLKNSRVKPKVTEDYDPNKENNK